DSLKLKLLEVYQEAGNAAAFETLANKIRTERGDSRDDPVWQQVVAMGAAVSPGHPMFGDGAGGAPAPSNESAESGEMPDMLDLSDLGLGDDDLDVLGGDTGDSGDLDLSDLGLGDDDPGTTGSGSSGNDFDLDLGDIDLGDGDDGDEPLGAADLGGLDGGSPGDPGDDSFDLGGAGAADNDDFGDLDLGALGSEMTMDDLGGLDTGSMDESELGESGESFDLDQLSGIDGLEFDSGTTGETLTADADADSGGLDFGAADGLEEASGDASDDGLGLDLGDMGGDLELGDDSGELDALGGANLELDSAKDAESSLSVSGGSLNETMILDGLEFEEGAGSASPADEMIPSQDSGGDDEVGTKLDLAKAYIDMGDPDGALDLLNEVMREGSSSQKQEAQALAADLN
ncbi:MAG: FimV/HubP family polar landmark protein, partial [Gammaproteobacteria bacterium]